MDFQTQELIDYLYQPPINNFKCIKVNKQSSIKVIIQRIINYLCLISYNLFGIEIQIKLWNDVRAMPRLLKKLTPETKYFNTHLIWSSNNPFHFNTRVLGGTTRDLGGNTIRYIRDNQSLSNFIFQSYIIWRYLIDYSVDLGENNPFTKAIINLAESTKINQLNIISMVYEFEDETIIHYALITNDMTVLAYLIDNKIIEMTN